MRTRDYPVIWTSPVPDGLKKFEENGFDAEPGFYPIQRIEQARDEAYALHDGYTGDGVTYEKNGSKVRLICGVQYVQPRLVDILVTPKLISLAESILGSDVYIHQFRLHYKPAFTGGEFFWHSDYAVWRWGDGMMRDTCVHFAFPLEEMRQENGPLMVSPGTHKFLDDIDWDSTIYDGTGTGPYREGDNNVIGRCRCTDAQLELVARNGVQTVTGKPGDLIYFDTNLMHTSGPNLSPWGRLIAFIAISSIHNKLQDPPTGYPARPNWVASRDYNRL
ncbi:MAG: phytanoyl-CoA dioxygenase family protein [Acidiferrobacterales bacterium]